VGTEWQNIGHRHIPEDLMSEMKQWADKEGKNIKMATKPFKKKIDEIPEENKRATAEDAYKSACAFIKGFRADGSASYLNENIG